MIVLSFNPLLLFCESFGFKVHVLVHFALTEKDKVSSILEIIKEVILIVENYFNVMDFTQKSNLLNWLILYNLLARNYLYCLKKFGV